MRRDGRLQGVGDRMKLSPRHSKLVGLALANTSKQINRKPHSTACARALSRISVVLHDNSFRVHLGPLLILVGILLGVVMASN